MVAGQYVVPQLFRSQLDCLSMHGWQCAPLLDVAKRVQSGDHPSSNEFVITFDDGYSSVYKHAIPEICRRGMSATVFVVAGAIGGINEWDYKIGDRQEQIMSAQQIREISDLGLEIGSHTLTHPHLTSLDEQALKRELIDSKHKLEDLIGKEVAGFSYPYGDYDERVLAATATAGYKYAVSTRLGAVGKANVYEIPRVNVRWSAVGPLLMRKIARARRISELCS